MSRLTLLLALSSLTILTIGCAAATEPPADADSERSSEATDSNESPDQDPSSSQVQIDDDQVKPARDAVTGFNTGKRLYKPTN